MNKFKHIYVSSILIGLLMQLAWAQTTTDYIPPSIDNPNGAIIEWQEDGSVIVKGGLVTFTSGIKALPTDYLPSNQIKASEMLLIDERNYMEDSGNSDGITLGVYLNEFNSKPDWWSTDDPINSVAKIKIFRRTDNQPSSSSTSFGFDELNYDDLLVYGRESTRQSIFLNETLNQTSYNYSEWNLTFSQNSNWHFFNDNDVKSNSFLTLWNRPQSDDSPKKWVRKAEVALVIVASIATLGYADYALFSAWLAYAEAASQFATTTVIDWWSTRVAMEAAWDLFEKKAIGLFTSGALSATLLYIYNLSNPASNSVDPFLIQPNFTSSMELLVPDHIPVEAPIYGIQNGNQVTLNDKERRTQMSHNDLIDKITGSTTHDCSFDVTKKCYYAPFSGVVSKLEAKDAHISDITIPGALYRKMTPYQMFKNFDYVYEPVGHIVLNPNNIDGFHEQKTSDVFTYSNGNPVNDILPFHVYKAPSDGISVELKFENYGESTLKYFYLVDKEPPLTNASSLKYKNLGEFGYIGSDKYYLYRYLTERLAENDTETSININMDTDGPFLAGDNILLRNYVEINDIIVNNSDKQAFFDDTNIPIEQRDFEATIGGKVLIADPDNINELLGSDEWLLYVGGVTPDIDSYNDDNPNYEDGAILTENFAIQDDFIVDFVFEDDYEKIPLTKLESFAKKYKHLPYIASEDEVKKALHYSTKDMIMGQLRHLEELYLHAFEQQARIEQIKNEKKDLLIRLNKLNNKIQQLENN